MTEIIPTFSVNTEKNYKKIFDLYQSLNIKEARLNLTRYSLDFYRNEIRKIYNLQLKNYGSIVCDLILDVPYPGTKARIDFDGEKSSVEIEKGTTLFITNDEDQKSIENNIISVDNFSNLSLVKKNEILEIDDGRLKLKVIDKNDNFITTNVLNSGKLKWKKSINRKGIVYFQEKRSEYIDKLFNLFLDIKPKKIVFSFLEKESQINKIKERFNSNKQQVNIIPKIETPKAISNLDEISRHCDQMMLGRGDLVLTGDSAKLGQQEDEFFSTCLKNKVEPIIATDIMNSISDLNFEVPLRSDLIDLDYIVKKRATAIVTSGTSGLGIGLKKIRQILTKIDEARN